VIVPSTAMHTEPLAEPGNARPSPESDVTVAVNFASAGSAGVVPFGGLTYPGQLLPTLVVSVGALITVVEPVDQVMVPPVASAVAGPGVEEPPVSPPVQPLITMLPVMLPVMVVHVMVLGVQAKVNVLSSVIVPSVPMHTEPFDVDGSNMPLPESAVTEDTKDSAVGSAGGVPVFGGLTYPGHFFGEIDVSVGAATVVVEPDAQVVVPPVASERGLNGNELPPVFPPVHPLTTIVVDTVPVSVVQLILPPAAPAVPDSPNVSPATGISMAAQVIITRRIASLSLFWDRPQRTSPR
jgi:hypothetical protein